MERDIPMTEIERERDGGENDTGDRGSIDREREREMLERMIQVIQVERDGRDADDDGEKKLQMIREQCNEEIAVDIDDIDERDIQIIEKNRDDRNTDDGERYR